MSPLRVGVLGSGKGSNFVAVAEACAAKTIFAEVALVISDVRDAAILERANKMGIRNCYVDPGKFKTRLEEAAEAEYVRRLQEAGVELMVLAGFMRIVKSGLLNAFAGRVINIHPSLLPAFPGLRAWEQALAYGVKVTGCTVHFVDAGVDTGPVIGQETVPVLAEDTAETLHHRIQEAEHRLYPRVVGAIAENRIRVEGRRTIWA